MSEADVVAANSRPFARGQLREDLEALGVQSGELLLVHSSLSALGYVLGGAVAVIQALLDAVGPEGTLCVPTHSSDNSEPSRWENPPIPESWWPLFRSSAPGYHPAWTPTRGMGRIPEIFRTLPGVIRSGHPTLSMAAHGPRAQELMQPHPLDDPMGWDSPLGKIARAQGRVLLLGVDHDRNTTMHLSEYDLAGFPRHQEGAALLVDGQRQWVTYEDTIHDDEDFLEIGRAFDQSGEVRVGPVGAGTAKLFFAQAAAEFARSFREASAKEIPKGTHP